MSTDGNSPEEQRKRKFASDCFKKATEAMSKQNWDYAVEMFSVAIKMAPDNLMYRQSLRGVERKKYKDNKSGKSMAFLTVNSIRSKIKKARGAKNWAEMDTAAEEGLTVNPWDAHFNADLGEACRERGCYEVATFAYETAVENAPENKDMLIALANMYERKRDYTNAVKTLERVMRLDPLNGAIRSKIQSLGADEVIDRGGYGGATNTQEVKSDAKQGYEESVKGGAKNPQEMLAPGESAENDLLRAIKKDPGSLANYLKLADYYKREGDLEKAAGAFKLALDVSGDPNVREQMEDVELEMVRKNLLFAKEAANQSPTDAVAKQNRIDLAKELLDQEIEIYSRRTERYPNDMKLKNELAQRFMQANKPALAIPLLQQASKDSRLEAQVLVNLGLCFLKQKQNPLAARQFKKAVEKLTASEHPQPFKDCHYWLARLAEEAGDLAGAEAHYLEILGIDYAYKDVSARLEKIQGELGKSGDVDLGNSDE
ncbi:MAG: tetratricopeptide repeat protein [Candidatus Saccharimonas sp.]|nr:tetratricopeptide repeat protein [Planctomycetaceae bacterium]